MLVRAAVTLAVGALMAGTWMLDGLILPNRVSSGSMAGTLLGPHVRVRCAACGLPIDCGMEFVPSNGLVRCLNCGYRENDVHLARGWRGARMLIDRSAFAWRRPRRWELVVFRCRDEPGELCVKRVLGLPGETVAVREGDVYIDGQIARKPPDVLRSMAVQVRDDRFRPARGAAWLPDSRHSGWRAVESGYEFLPRAASTAAPEQQIDWLRYRPLALPDRAGQPKADLIDDAPIYDDLAYNAGQSRQLFPVHDLVLRCRLRTDGASLVRFQIRQSHGTFEAAIDAARGAVSVTRDSERLGSASAENLALGLADDQAPSMDSARDVLVEMAVVDQQVQLAVDGKLLLEKQYSVKGNVARSGVSLAIGIGGAHLGTVRIDDLEVLRDVYYTPSESRGSGATRLGPGEYFVLGDNSSASDDSRSWASAALTDSALVGKPIAWW